MQNLSRAMMAALAATIVLSVLMLMKGALGIMPQLNLPQMIADSMGSPGAPLIGWTVHMMIGVVVYGTAMAALAAGFPGEGYVGRGLLLGLVGWLLMMVLLMPMMGAGLFGMQLGILAPVMTLMLHLVFGGVLGWFYGRLTPHTSDDVDANFV